MNTLKLSIVVLSLLFAGAVEAKCYSFQKGGEIRVCVKGDGFPEQRKAEAICTKVKGSPCGDVNSISSSCGTGMSGGCYDESGRKHNTLDGY
jgi:hypothetical protein